MITNALTSRKTFANIFLIQVSPTNTVHCCWVFHNNNNNYKTCIAPIFLKRIELSGAPSGGFGQTHSSDTM